MDNGHRNRIKITLWERLRYYLSCHILKTGLVTHAQHGPSSIALIVFKDSRDFFLKRKMHWQVSIINRYIVEHSTKDCKEMITFTKEL
jgi:hypothetical protein